MRASTVRVLILPSTSIESGVTAVDCSVCSRPAADRSSWHKERAGMEGKGGSGKILFLKGLLVIEMLFRD